jgi:hypothetical protein
VVRKTAVDGLGLSDGRCRAAVCRPRFRFDCHRRCDRVTAVAAGAWETVSKVPFASKPDAEIRALESVTDRSLWVSGTYWDDEHKRTSPMIARAVC